MKTDTSEKGLEDLIVAGLTGSGAGILDNGSVHEGAAGYGAGGWILGLAYDYNRDYALDLAQLTLFLSTTQPELAQLKNPSMAYVLERAVGHWGGVLISVGLLISLSGALLSWLMLSAETLYSAARDGAAPDWLAGENARGVPSHALWLTSASVQAFLLLTLWSE